MATPQEPADETFDGNGSTTVLQYFDGDRIYVVLQSEAPDGNKVITALDPSQAVDHALTLIEAANDLFTQKVMTQHLVNQFMMSHDDALNMVQSIERKIRSTRLDYFNNSVERDEQQANALQPEDQDV